MNLARKKHAYMVKVKAVRVVLMMVQPCSRWLRSLVVCYVGDHSDLSFHLFEQFTSSG